MNNVENINGENYLPSKLAANYMTGTAIPKLSLIKIVWIYR